MAKPVKRAKSRSKTTSKTSVKKTVRGEKANIAKSSAKTRVAKSPKKVASPKNKVEYVEIKIDESVLKLVGILILGIIAVVALMVYGNIKNVSNNSVNVPEQGAGQNQASVVPSVIGDAPVLGDPKAPVTIIEYADFECPYCRRHDVQTFPQIKKEYIDTGKVKYVYKNFIAVPSHKPSALPAAYAAYCVYKVGGNNKFWAFKEKITEAYDKGEYGIPQDPEKRLDDSNAIYKGLRQIAISLGVDAKKYDDCLKNKKQAEDYVNKDINYVMQNIAPKVSGGVGTPLFVVCKSPKNNNDTCQGQVIMGAYPFDTFKQAIDSLLK